MITGLNHVTLAVRDVPRALAFYRDVLGAQVDHVWEAGAYLSFGELWLCLSLDGDAEPTGDYTHFALNTSAKDFAAMSAQVMRSGAKIWKDNRSEGPSLYFLDPDGHKLELHAGSLASRLAAIQTERVAC